MRICLYDSGQGAHFLGQKLSKLDIKYFIDTKNYPYGTKTQNELSDLLTCNLKRLDRDNYDYLVIACNTASIAIENDPKIANKLKTKTLKITDWIQIKPQNLDKPTLIGSTFTINSKYYPHKLSILGLNNNLFSLDMQKMINAIEKKQPDIIEEQIDYLKNFMKTNNSKTLILGCTHFTGISDQLNKKLDCNIIDPSLIVAQFLTDQL